MNFVNRLFRFTAYLLLLLISVLIFVVFLPQTYHVPQLQQRESTRYWTLSTGSKIGYVLISAKGIKKSNPIIFLQGGPGGFISDRNIEILKPLSDNGYDIYLYDQIGSGHSARLKNINEYSADRHKRDLEEIIKKIGAKKVILIGQSWGAILATLFIAGNPDKIEKLIVTSPGPILPIKQELEAIEAPDSLHLMQSHFSNRQANEKTSSLRSKFISFWARKFGGKLASDKEADEFQTYLDNELNKSTVCDTSKALKSEGGSGFYAQIMTLKSFSQVQDLRPLLRHSGIPVLVMKGQCDNQKWGYTCEYLELFPNHDFVIIPDAGHSISIEQPALYLKTIRDFLNE